MGTKLIIIEGLPGSGKSTTAKIVQDILKENGVKTELYSEGDYNHPADFDGVSYFRYDDFYKLKQNNIKSKELLENIKIDFHNGYLIPYRKAIEEEGISFVEELFNEILLNDVYKLSLHNNIDLIVEHWSDFTNKYIDKDKVVIFECCFIQNPVTVSMIRDNASKDITISYIKKLQEKIKSLDPILIYLDQKNIEKSFNRIIRERPKEWFDGFIDYYTNQGYGLVNNLHGLDGTITILKERAKLESDIYDNINFIKYKVDNSELNIDLLKEKIKILIEPHLYR